MNLDELNTSIKTRMKEVSELIKKEGRDAIGKAFNELFDKYPELGAVRWTQYTPYFNDGDECTFRVGDMLALVDIDKFNIDKEHQYGCEDEVELDGRTYGDISIKYPHRDLYKDNKINDIESDISDIATVDDQVMLAVFGDHSRVTATRDGFEVEHYSHE